LAKLPASGIGAWDANTASLVTVRKPVSAYGQGCQRKYSRASNILPLRTASQHPAAL